MNRPLARIASALSLLPALLPALLAGPVQAEQRFGAITFQNDAFVGRDGGGYTSGFAASRWRLAEPNASVQPPALLKGIGPLLGVHETTLASTSLVQLMTTPSDLSLAVPDPKDAPYVGALFLRSVQVSVKGSQADLVAIDLGVIGPAAGAEQTQRAVHRITGSTRPNGWDSQPSNRPLVGLGRYRAWRQAGASHGGTGTDAVLIAGGSGSNLDATAGLTLMMRYGSQLERSYASTLPINGPRVEPQAFYGGWFVYAALSADRVFHRIRVSDGGDGASLRKNQAVVSLGVARSWRRSSLSLSIVDTSPQVMESDRHGRYGSLTWLWRID